MQTFTKLLITFFIIINFQSCDFFDVQKGMVRFDQAFIPVYYYTWAGDLENAKDAAVNLQYQWYVFEQKHRGMLPEDEEWQAGFEMTTSWLEDAYVGLEVDMKDLALNQLDHARYEMMELRACKEIDYYLDDIYNFQIDLAHTYEVGSDDMLCLLEWEEFDLMVRNLHRNWEAILAKNFDSELFEFNRMETAKYQSMQRMLAKKLRVMVNTLDCANHFEVAQKAKETEIYFMKMLTNFGSFSEAAESIALEI